MQGATQDLPNAMSVRVCTAVRESDFGGLVLGGRDGRLWLYSCLEEKRSVVTTNSH